MSNPLGSVGKADLIAAVEQAADGIIITDRSGNIQYVNPAFTRLTCYSREEVLGQNPRLLKSGQEQALYEELWSTILAGRVWKGELTNRRKDGSFYREEMQITPVQDEAGTTSSFIAIKRDVTARRAAEEGQALLAAVVANSEDAIITCSPSGIVLTWNRGAEVTTGYSESEAVGRPVALIVPPDRLASLEELIGCIRRGQVVSHYSGFCLHKNGKCIPVSVSGAPIKNSTGEVTAISAIVRNLSGIYEAEQARALLASIVESSDDAIHAIRLDGTIAAWNRGAERLFGYTRDEILGKNIAALAPPDRKDELDSYLDAVKRGCPPPPFERVLVARDGRRVAASISISPTRNTSGELTGYAAIVRSIEGRLQAEQQLRESEARFREVFEHAPAGICVTGTDKRLIKANEAFCRMLGYSEEELIGRSWVEFTHPDDLDASLGRLDALRTSPDHMLESEKRYISRDGQTVWARSRISTLRGADGGSECFIVHTEDITERKRAKEAVRESENRFRIMADGCPTLLWVTNAEGGNDFINRKYREFCGATAEEMEGQKWQMVVHPDDQEYIVSFQRAVQSRAPFYGEARIRRIDGDWRWVGSYAEPRFSPSGEYLGHVGLSPDITERREAERALQESESKFRQLAESIREVFWIAAVDTEEVLYVSPAYELVWGTPCASLYADPLSWSHAIHPEDRARAISQFRRQMQGEALESEYRIHTPDGREKWIRDRAFPIRDESGRLQRVVGIAEEVSERKRYEDELIQSRQAADAANEAKSRFLANMSHEIRTPMNGVIGMVQLLQQTELTEEQKRYAEIAQTSGRTLLAVIDEILDLSKIESGKLSLEKRDFSLRNLIDGLDQLFAAQAVAKGLEYHSTISTETPPILCGDSHRLRQVLTNLIGNAIKFTERGKITLTLGPSDSTSQQTTLHFEVSDTGIGLPADSAASLFLPFVQADASTTRKYGGTGLGLTICKQLVAMMGGQIGVRSAEGEGSTFWFTAVFDRSSSGHAPVVADSTFSCNAAMPAKVARPAGEAHILVAEDNAVNRDVATAQLRKLGYRCTTVVNGAEAVAAVEDGSFDLVLMDCEMPVMDGFEATTRIRSSKHSDIPIIAVTADVMPSDRERCLKVGMCDYLPKPVELRRLGELLARWLSGVVPPSIPVISERVMAAAGPVVFNGPALLQRLMGDRQLATKILRGFLADVPHQLDELRRFLDEGNVPGTRLRAHGLKGSAATVSAEQLSALALAVEQAGAGGQLEECAALLSQVQNEFERFKNDVESYGWV